MDKIEFQTVDVQMPEVNFDKVTRWIEEVAKTHGKDVGRLSYLFCSDSYMIEVNRESLNHDFYTDIITWDYTFENALSGDMLISTDMVRSNAAALSESLERELLRVIIHGVLHLCGIDDKGPGEREIMEAHEDEALKIWTQII